jgi:hypothetical protein
MTPIEVGSCSEAGPQLLGQAQFETMRIWHSHEVAEREWRRLLGAL